MRAGLCAVGFVCLGMAHAQSAEDFFRVIRAGDSAALIKLSAKPVNVKDRLDTTPLHYAALYGNTDSVRILLEHGADVKARNKSDATPLIYAAYNFDKTRLLVEKGADVNAHSGIGMTPLLVAVSSHGNTETVRYLLEKGADVKAEGGQVGSDALQTAAFKGDAAMIRLLLQKGIDPKRLDKGGFNALLYSFSVIDGEKVRILVDSGSDVNAANTFAGMVKNGPIDLVHTTPLISAAPDAEPTTVKALLKAGAHADVPDNRKMSPLMLAVSTDYPTLATIRQLIEAKCDVNAKDKYGESVLDWAMKFRNPEVIAILKEAGAKSSLRFVPPARPAGSNPTVSEAVSKSTILLAKSGDVFFTEGGGCVGCHHQPLNARVYAAVSGSHHQADPRLQRAFLDAMVASRPFELSSLPQLVARGGDFDEFQAQTEALIALGEPASPTTDAILHYLAARQDGSGAWFNVGGPRPPLESSTVSRTALAVRAFVAFGWGGRKQEFDERIARARTWLLAAHPVTSYEQAERIKGLQSAGASRVDIDKAAAALLKEQRADGGWAQNPYLDSDAYATGIVLSTLQQQGLLKPADPAYSRGVEFLLKTQFPDGSWYVRSRAPKLQPYFQSAFPFDHDQWISTSATAYAVMALAPALQ